MPCSKVSPHDNNIIEQNESDRHQSPYDRLMHSLQTDPKWQEEVTLGRRIGLYKFRGEIGAGNFSQVKMAIHQLTRERVAVKILDKSKMDPTVRRMVDREIACMEMSHHPNIIRLYEVVETYSKLYLVLEFAGGGELYNKITINGKFEEEQAKILFAQLVSAVCFMHERNIVHRDIKAENVFFSSPNRVKLGDFGFSVELSKGTKQHLTTFCGSPPYAAPELFRDEHYIGCPVDVWALGILLYFMVVGNMPFKGANVATLKLNIIQGIYPVPKNLSRQCVQLIDSILKQEPRERISSKEILGCDWLVDIETIIPPEVQAYSLSPTVPPHRGGDDVQISEIEKTARERLLTLGINKELLASQSVLGSRSHVIGCYRIVVHRIQKQLGCFLELDVESSAVSKNSSTTKANIKNNKTFSYFKVPSHSSDQTSNNIICLTCWKRWTNSISDVRSLSDMRYESDAESTSLPPSAAPSGKAGQNNRQKACIIL